MNKSKNLPILEWMGVDEESDAEYEWDYLLDSLTEILEKIAKRNTHFGYWEAIVNNFGWRSLDGHKKFKAFNGQEFLRAILPDTDCHFRIFRERNQIKIQNYHHDSPMGKEWYYITPLNQKDAEQFMNYCD